jgi:hypothetical protein
MIYTSLVYSQDRPIQIQIIDPNIDSSSLQKKYQVSKDKASFTSLPNKKIRDKFLGSFLAPVSWDETQKDIFYMDIKSKSLDELMEKYPELPKLELAKLKGNI